MAIFLAAIVILLSALACYAFISQSIEKKMIQKQRILMTLKTKQRNLVHLINGFPPNFLTTELLSLIYRALIDACEQLSKIEPKDPRHLDDITLYTNQLGTLPKTNSAQRPRVDNPQQMKEIRQHLQELQHFLAQQEALKIINKVQLGAYTDQVKRLSLQMAVDAYLYHAKLAQQAGKLRLAIHYFTLAKKLLIAENTTRAYDKQIAQLDDITAKLEEKARLANEAPAEIETAPDTENKRKDVIAADDMDSWKKKQIYD
ncbi:hypothetical protein [Cellvibrio sp.]|uniref:hypothetical protein n=1 Tax=Cellvibrio sp. TaxID=1965322 RepID=UPI00396485C3